MRDALETLAAVGIVLSLLGMAGLLAFAVAHG